MFFLICSHLLDSKWGSFRQNWNLFIFSAIKLVILTEMGIRENMVDFKGSFIKWTTKCTIYIIPSFNLFLEKIFVSISFFRLIEGCKLLKMFAMRTVGEGCIYHTLTINNFLTLKAFGISETDSTRCVHDNRQYCVGKTFLPKNWNLNNNQNETWTWKFTSCCVTPSFCILFSFYCCEFLDIICFVLWQISVNLFSYLWVKDFYLNYFSFFPLPSLNSVLSKFFLCFLLPFFYYLVFFSNSFSFQFYFQKFL